MPDHARALITRAWQVQFLQQEDEHIRTYLGFITDTPDHALDNGGINLGNYEVQFDYFPVKFKDSFVPPVDDQEWVQVIHWQPEAVDLCGYAGQIDYLETWGEANLMTLLYIRKCYTQVFEHGQQRIYVPK